MTSISLGVKTAIITLGFLLVSFLIFAPFASAQTATLTPTPTSTSTPTPTSTSTATVTTTATTTETLPDAGISLPTIVTLGAAILLITLSLILAL